MSAQGVMGISIFPSHRARPLLFRKLHVSYLKILKEALRRREGLPAPVLPFLKSKFLIFVIKISLNSLDCIYVISLKIP